MKNNALLIVISAIFVALTPAFAEEAIEPDGDFEEEIELGANVAENAAAPPPATTPASDDAEGGEEVIELLEEEMVVVEEEIEIVEGELEKLPELIEFVEAEYPERFIREGVKGSVILELLVSETGAVESVTVVRTLNPELDASAMAAAAKFKFSPAMAHGEAVAVMLRYEYRFGFEEVVITTEIDDTASVADEVASEIAGDTAGVAAAVVDDDIDDGSAEVLDGSFELTVYGQEKSVEVAHRRITVTEVKRIPGLGGEALLAVQAMPGVGRASFGGTEVIVRGAPSWASRYFIDGMYVPILYHMGASTSKSSYPSEAVEAIDFYPGGFGARYGGATMGVIEMRSRRPKTDRLQGYVDLSNLDGALFIEGPINERVSFMASGRRGFAGDLLKFAFEKFDLTGVGIVAAPYYWDFLLRTDVKIDDNNDMFVKIIGSRDSLGVFMPGEMGFAASSEIDAAVDQLNVKIQFYTMIAGLDSRLGERWKNSLRLSAFTMDQKMSVFGMMTMDQPVQGGHIRNEVSYRASDNVTVNAGADVMLWNVDMKLTTITGQNTIGNLTFEDNSYGIAGGYATVEWRPTDRLLFVPGIRYDYYTELDYSGSIVPAFWNYGFMDNRRGASGEPAFRISGRYEYMDGHTAKAAVGTYSQSPEPFGMAVHDIVGEPDLPATKAAQYVVGYEWRISDFINLDVQGYYNRMWDVARFYDSRVDYDPALGHDQRNMFPDGKGRAYGMELMLRHNRSEKFFGWLSYTLSRSEEWSKVDGEYVLSSRDEPHHLQLLGSWKLRNNWEVGARARFVSGKPTSRIIGTVENENSNNISAVYEEGRSGRLDPFFQVDFRFDKRFVYNRWSLTYYVDLQNVLWPLYKSSEFEYYNYNYTRSQKIAMIPMIAGGVRAEF